MGKENQATISSDLTQLVGKIRETARETDSLAKFPTHNIDLLGKAGLLGLLVPKEYGGTGANPQTFASTAQSIASGCASTGMIFVMHCCATQTIAQHHEGKQSALLKAAAAGKHLSTLACSERATGANFYASFATSSSSDDSFILNGDKCFVTSGRHANSYVVSTRAVGSEDCINTSIYVVPEGVSGATFHGQWNGLGLRGNSSVQLKLEDCRIASENLLSEQGTGLQVELGSILPHFLVGAASVYNGIAEAAFTATVEHVRNRVHTHTGEQLTMLPVLRNRVARMKVRLDSSVALTMQAAQLLEQNDEGALIKLLEAKQTACTTAVEVATMAMESCGGIAFSTSLSVERHLRDAQAGGVMAPTNDIALDLIGRAALGMPLM